MHQVYRQNSLRYHFYAHQAVEISTGLQDRSHIYWSIARLAAFFQVAMADKRGHSGAVNTLPRLICVFEPVRIINYQPPVEKSMSCQRQAIKQGDNRLFSWKVWLFRFTY